MTPRQKLAVRMPVGCVVECIDASPEGDGHSLVLGAHYTVDRYDRWDPCPLVALKELYSYGGPWFAPRRFRRVNGPADASIGRRRYRNGKPVVSPAVAAQRLEKRRTYAREWARKKAAAKKAGAL